MAKGKTMERGKKQLLKITALMMTVLVLWMMLAACSDMSPGEPGQGWESSEDALTEEEIPQDDGQAEDNSEREAQPDESLPDPEIPEEENPDSADILLSEEEYRQAVWDIFKKLSNASAEASAGMASTDINVQLEAAQLLVEKAVPLYQEMASLQVQDSLQQIREKIVVGAEASAELLNLSQELLELVTAPPSDMDVPSRIQEIQEQTSALEAQAQQLSEGLSALGLGEAESRTETKEDSSPDAGTGETK